MLTWLRFERNNDEEWPIRPDGVPGTSMNCCLLLLSGPTDELLLLQDGCLELLDCQPDNCCLLLNTDTGGENIELLLNSSTTDDPGFCLELNSCAES
jgi:hypothetical protein